MNAPRIARARVSSAENHLGDRFWNPKIRWDVKHAVFVELETAEGLVGLGECWCFDNSPAPLATYLHSEVLPEIVGELLDDIPEIIDAMARKATLTARHGMLASATSGVDLAAWDLRAKSATLPLWQCLNGEGPGEAHLYASGGLYGVDKGPAELAKELNGYVDRGYPAVKIKVGGVSEAEDIERIRAARTAIGPDIRLIIDGVYSFDVAGAARFYEKVEPLGIEAFQSPLPAEDLSGMRLLCQQGIPVIGVEAEYREEILRELIEGRAVTVLQLAPIACGGPSRIARLVARLRAAGIGLTLETSSTAIATLAAAQIAATWGEVRDIEVHQLHQLFFDQTPLGQPRIVSPWRLPDTPGLGVELRLERITPCFELEHSVRPRGFTPRGTAPGTGRSKKRSPQSAA